MQHYISKSRKIKIQKKLLHLFLLIFFFKKGRFYGVQRPVFFVRILLIYEHSFCKYFICQSVRQATKDMIFFIIVFKAFVFFVHSLFFIFFCISFFLHFSFNFAKLRCCCQPCCSYVSQDLSSFLKDFPSKNAILFLSLIFGKKEKP